MFLASSRTLPSLTPPLLRTPRALTCSNLSSSTNAPSTSPPPKPPPPVNTLVDVPPDAYRAPGSSVPIRKPPNFTPAVQRWSAVLPDQLVVGTFGVQSLAPDSISKGSFMRWAAAALTPTPSSASSSSSFSSPSSFAPVAADHARYTDSAGYTHHVIVAYWREPASYARWAAMQEAWWSSAAERDEGVYREVVCVPRERAETIYWLDYPGGIMRDTGTQLYPTPYCGYYGAMRDRLGCAADDALEPAPALQAPPKALPSGKGRWRVTLPRNVAVIRSAHTWEYMDSEQRADYEAKLRPPLRRGMDFLATSPESGCLSLRWLTGANADGSARPEAHATAYFASLGHMEAWAERHKTHAAIFGAAVARYKHYGGENQLRTWHEVFVLPQGQTFEYINCHPQTGLLPVIQGERVG